MYKQVAASMRVCIRTVILRNDEGTLRRKGSGTGVFQKSAASQKYGFLHTPRKKITAYTILSRKRMIALYLKVHAT